MSADDNNGDIEPRGFRICVVSAGASDPSSTGELSQAVAVQTARYLEEHGLRSETSYIRLNEMAEDIARAGIDFHFSQPLAQAMETMLSSDGLVAATPIYKASYSGLFKSFWDLVSPESLFGMPVALVATGGSLRHALVPDSAMRELFAFFRAVPVSTSVMGTKAEQGTEIMRLREARAGRELGVLMLADVHQALRQATEGYRKGMMAF
ncbi:oxidoreductase [Bifidobacterium aemilianum]|uniref:Oxidoreductase n=1 Tax=Bifidobacterium aemilianum TaxID=2493120 RepID=A0A366K829_9BIFI|nr:NAD(P)H-dependent oxidoreductase [Bifidobacterium aemilianum]RBP97318.1 oxidoreductase [Bifidobacterium aemilianum]